jgi:hypothetical protein
MIKTTVPTFGRLLTTLALTGFMACLAWADQTTQTVPFDELSGGSGSDCPGTYTGFAKMTNSAGSVWLTPPTNATSGTFTNASGFGAPFVGVAHVTRKSDGVTWCDTNSVTFPATNSAKYQLVIYVKNTPPPPTNNQPMTLQVIWQ